MESRRRYSTAVGLTDCTALLISWCFRRRLAFISLAPCSLDMLSLDGGATGMPWGRNCDGLRHTDPGACDATISPCSESRGRR